MFDVHAENKNKNISSSSSVSSSCILRTVYLDNTSVNNTYIEIWNLN